MKQKVKSIPVSFVAYGYTFDLLKRNGAIAMYKQHREEIISYEVHKVRTRRNRLNSAMAEEYLASKGEFGLYAWSYAERIFAERKYVELRRLPNGCF